MGAVALSHGDRLGHYQIVGLIGAGGMGEVYRARDQRLKRDVALKVLYRSAGSPEHFQLLSREARAAGALNHPNIPAVFDVDIEAPIPYIVSELLEGESLRQRLDRGTISHRKAVEYGIQIANALAAAHEKGICHRDVKPGNVFITSDGRAKLLDFGLAKLGRPETPARPDDSTASPATSALGAGCGTAGYMAPEQVLGEPVDVRTDLFALGAVLYEMFSGVRAFQGPSPVETMHAVLHEEPLDLLEIKPGLRLATVQLVRRCLEKNRTERFQCARDLAFSLQQLYEVPAAGPPEAADHRRRTRLLAGAAALAALSVLALLALAELRGRSAATFQQITFQRGSIGAARFASGSDDILYSESREGGSFQVWQTSPRSPGARPLGYIGADVLAARAGELILLVRRRQAVGKRFVGTLAVAPLGGGAPRELLEDVEDADWAPGEAQLAVVRRMGAGRSRLEYPIGRVLYESPGSIHHPRVSRDGQRVAFLEDRTQATLGGVVAVVDLSGRRTELTGEWPRGRGLAWSPRGDEVWFTTGEAGARALRAVNLRRRQRLVLAAPASLTLRDTSPDGRVLLTRDDERTALVGVPPGDSVEKDLSWFDRSGVVDVSADGNTILFGDRFGVYVRRTDGSPPVRLGLSGSFPQDLSPDGRLVVATTGSASQLVLLPTGAGDPRLLPNHGISSYWGALWFPDGRRILFVGREPGRGPRSYVQDLSGTAPRPLTPDNTWVLAISPDGTLAAAVSPGQKVSLWPIAGGPPRTVAASEPGDRPVGWTPDGRLLWVFRRGEIPASIYQLDLVRDTRKLWKTLLSSDFAGVSSIDEFCITPTGHAYFFSYERVLSDLYVVSGLR